MKLSKPQPFLRHLALLIPAVLLLGTAALVSVRTEAGGVGPDVTVFDLNGVRNSGASGGIRAYSVGTTSCNIGDQPLWWCNDAGDTFCETNQHPVIAQNLYRLKDGRFEQLGASWLKHGFFSLNNSNSECGDGTCVRPPHGGDQLGIGCTDPYGASLNGSRPLGMRSEVNAATGEFPYPFTEISAPSVIDQRIQVLESDLDPLQNAGARYFVEGHYVAPDDAAAGNGLNNASYREVSVASGSLNLNFVGETVREKAAIEVWPTLDKSVEFLRVDTQSNPVERFHVARKVSVVSPGTYRYEYAVHNLNSHRSARAFGVKFPGPTEITGIGFHDVDHHSGEPYDTTDWVAEVSAEEGSVVWATESLTANPDANALRWGTLFNFWFEADRPSGGVKHSLELFRGGGEGVLTFEFFDPDLFLDGFESGDTTAWTEMEP